MGLTVVPGNMIEDGTVTDSNFDNTTITSADMAVDPRNASNYTSGDVPLAQLDNVPAVPPTDTSAVDDDIATLGFNIASADSLAKYNLMDQTVDAFEDASGVDAGSSTNEVRNASKYYSGLISASGNATGGTITTSGGKTIHTFTADGNFVVPGGSANVEYLVVAGGGGGGSSHAENPALNGYTAGGGGGAGGYRTGTLSSFSTASTSVSVGAGGAAGNAGNGGSGENSIFSTITSAGGGGGGRGRTVGVAGGSGGGGGSDYAGAAGNTPSASPSQGNAGGSSPAWGGGGGGGATAAGTNGDTGTNSYGGAGGTGTASSITGSSVTYAGGGGGGSTAGYSAPGGSGGGGAGGRHDNQDAVVGTANTGGGGGGSGGVSSTTGALLGAAGGSGVVILSYTTDAFDGPGNMTLVSTATTAQAVPTKGDMVMTYTNGAGTAVINTNIKGYVSRDGGTTYTQGTLVAGNTIGGHTVLSFHALDISAQPSGSSMKYKIETLVQSASMDTRIQAVSLGWS